MLILGIIVGLIILVLLVAVHEFGHGVVARRNGVKVEEFGIGFPPKAKGKKIKKSLLGKDVLYTLNWLPLGGFVRLKGEYDEADKKGDYGAASYWVKTKILFAGVFMNWVIAAVIFTILAVTGMPKIIDNQFAVVGDTREVAADKVQIVKVEDGSPAKEAGLQPEDRVLAVNGTDIVFAKELNEATSQNKGQQITLTIDRNGEQKQVDVMLRAENVDQKGYLGVASGDRVMLQSGWSAPLVGIGTTLQLTGATFAGIGDLLVNLVSGVVQSFSSDENTKKSADESLAFVGNSVAGPIGILGTIFPQAQQAGLTSLAMLTAIISVSLAVMNVLPIPALDGGRWVVMTLFRITRQKLTRAREESIQGTSMLIILGLFILITIADIGKVFG